MSYHMKRGMGDTVPGVDIASNLSSGWLNVTSPTQTGAFPDWCSWVPFADFMGACQVPTAAAQNAIVKSNITAAAGENAALAEEQYKAYLSDTAALAKIDPEGAAQYKFAGENPTLAAIFGAAPFGRAAGGALKLADEATSWLGVPAWIWLTGGLGVFAFVALSAGGPRRYGR